MDAVSPASPLCLSHFRSPSSPFSSSLSLSLSLTLSFLPFFSLSPPFTLFLVLGLCPAPFLFWTFPLVSLSCSALDSRNPFISRSRFRGSVPFFPPFRPICSLFPPPPPSPPTALPTSPLFRRPLRARFSGFSCAPFRPPAYPLRNRSTETCSGVAGTNENATEGNGVAYEIRAI